MLHSEILYKGIIAFSDVMVLLLGFKILYGLEGAYLDFDNSIHFVFLLKY